MSAPVVLIQASPHQGGVTDNLADAFAAHFPEKSVRRIVLREHQISPCRGCNACATPPHRCVLDSTDDAATHIFDALHEAQLTVICAPIYFYGLPAHCKGLIDRGQRLWHAQNAGAQTASESRRQAVVLLAAGRPRGEQLFAGALLTLKYFLALFNTTIADKRCLYGLDNVNALHAQAGTLADVNALGQHWAQHVCS